MKLSKEKQKSIAKERMVYLFTQAEKTFFKDSSLSDRYIQMALKLRDRYKVSLTKSQKIKFCKKCNSFLQPGKNCIVRIKNKLLIYHCKSCGKQRNLGMKN